MISFSRPLPLLAVSLAAFTAHAAPFVYQLDEPFEAKTLRQPPWTIDHAAMGDSGNVTLQTGIVRAGKQAVRLVNRYDDPGKARERTEMVAGSAGTLDWGQEYWIGFNFYLKDWTPSPQPEMVHQFHGVPHDYDWTHRSARNLTSITIKDDEMMLEVITVPKDGPASGGASGVPVWHAPVESNVWQDWVIHVRPSPGPDGLLEVWRNGRQIYRQQGPNVDLLDESGRPSVPKHYLKAGVYNWPWMRARSNVTTREIYYDEVRIGHVEGGYTGGYEGIVPAGGSVVRPPAAR